MRRSDISTLLSDRLRHDLQRDTHPQSYLNKFPLKRDERHMKAIVDARWMHS